MTQKLQNHLANGYDVKIGDYISQGFELFKKNAGGFIGYVVVYFAIALVLNFIPLVNLLFSILIGPCLLFGYYLVANKVYEGTIPDFGLFFKGFDYFGKIIVINLIVVLLVVAILIPVFLIVGFNFASLSSSTDAARELMTGGFIPLMLLAVFVIIFLSSCWTFASQFAVFHNMEAWQAMETSRKLVMKNWIMIFLFLIVIGFINIVGALFCGLGLLVTLPLTYCALHVAFRDLAGMPGEDNNDEIESIGSSFKI